MLTPHTVRVKLLGMARQQTKGASKMTNEMKAIQKIITEAMTEPAILVAKGEISSAEALEMSAANIQAKGIKREIAVGLIRMVTA
jgi:hypothetical protein